MMEIFPEFIFVFLLWSLYYSEATYLLFQMFGSALQPPEMPK